MAGFDGIRAVAKNQRDAAETGRLDHHSALEAAVVVSVLLEWLAVNVTSEQCDQIAALITKELELP